MLHQNGVSIFKSLGHEVTATYTCLLSSKTVFLKDALNLMACIRILLLKALLLGLGIEYGSAGMLPSCGAKEEGQRLMLSNAVLHTEPLKYEDKMLESSTNPNSWANNFLYLVQY
eukprot:2109559-Ditylum_brightwellii.AAC.1